MSATSFCRSSEPSLGTMRKLKITKAVKLNLANNLAKPGTSFNAYFTKYLYFFSRLSIEFGISSDKKLLSIAVKEIKPCDLDFMQHISSSKRKLSFFILSGRRRCFWKGRWNVGLISFKVETMGINSTPYVFLFQFIFGAF